MKYPFIFYREPATEIEIQEWEESTKIKIPSQYRDFLLQTNGAWVSSKWAYPSINPVTGETIGDLMSAFYSLEIIKLDTEVLIDAIKNEGSPGYHLHELLLIAHNECHSCRTFIGYKGEDYGKIILLDYCGYSDHDGDKNFNKVYLANSFDEFLQMFFKVPGYDD